nr:transposase [Cryobacterium sp. Y82]
MQQRWDRAPMDARLRGQAGNTRPHDQWIAFTARRKRPVVANTAITRELAGWCWSLAVMDD